MLSRLLHQRLVQGGLRVLLHFVGLVVAVGVVVGRLQDQRALQRLLLLVNQVHEAVLVALVPPLHLLLQLRLRERHVLRPVLYSLEENLVAAQADLLSGGLVGLALVDVVLGVELLRHGLLLVLVQTQLRFVHVFQVNFDIPGSVL